MNPVRKLWQDLVEKKLWPAALLLIVTAIAIPFVIGGGGDSAGVTEPAILPTPAAAAAPSAVELVGPPAVRTRAGAVRDPFRRTKAKGDATSAQTAAASSKPAASPAASSSSSSSSSSAKTSTGASRSSKTSAAKPAVKGATAVAVNHSSYQTFVRFTRPGGTRERPLARLAVLGNAAGPALQYLGVSRGGTHAIFVLGPNATPTSAGGCVVAEPCRAIRLREGDKLGVDVVGSDLAVRHYEVDILKLRRLHIRSATQARAWRARVDPAGGTVLRTLRQDPETASVLDRLRYTTLTGTVRLLTAS